MSNRTWSAWLTCALVACNGGDPAADGSTGTVTATGTGDDGPADDGPADDGPADDGPADDGPADDGPAESSDGTGDATSGDPTDPSVGESSSTGGTPSVCGDGTCDGDESAADCCTDCGCAEGSSCVDDACVVDPFCGDAACNGAETQDDCCVDCGCPDGSACEVDTCVVQPFCGDAACNGDETQDTCCNDCGCGENYTCEDNACACTGGYLHFENVMPDMPQFCFAVNEFYTQESVAYFNDNAGSGWVYMPDGGFVEYADDLGFAVDGTQQCCLLDVCGGNQVCPTPGGNYPCFCADPVPAAGSIDVCGENFVALCG